MKIIINTIIIIIMGVNIFKVNLIEVAKYLY